MKTEPSRFAIFVTGTLLYLLFILQAFITVPFTVFSGNASEIAAGFLDAIELLLLPLAIGYGVWLLLCLFLPKNILKYVFLFSLTLIFASYVQSNFLVWNYGKFDGQDIEWSRFRLESIVDIVVWLLILGGAYYCREWITGRMKRITILLMLVIGGSFAVSAYSFSGAWRSEGETPLSFFSYSKRKNVIFILLDTFPSPALDDLLIRDPSLKTTFKDFTFFRDTVGGFPTTSPSLPYILTGYMYDNSKPLKQFLSERLNQKSLPGVLESNGFQSDLATLEHFCTWLPVTSCQSVTKLGGSNPETVLRRELVLLLDLSLFRQAPQFIKKWIYNDEAWFLQRFISGRKGPRNHADSLDLVDRIINESKTGAAKPTFKFIHLMLPHYPIKLDAECKVLPKGAPSLRKPFNDQALCSLRVAEKLLDTFKRLDIYEKSTIAIFGDHGLMMNYSKNGETKGYGRLVQGMPLVLIKTPGVQEEFKISNVQGMLGDLPATVLDVLGIEGEFPGKSLFKIEDDEMRIRPYRRYGWKNRFWQSPYLPPMTEFYVQGPVRDPDSWHEKRALYPKE